jgi:hypothetical protein
VKTNSIKGRLIVRQGKLAYLREILLLVGAYFTYMFVRKVIVPGAPDIGLDNAIGIISLEKYVGIFWEHALQDAAASAGDKVLVAFNYLYIFTFFPMILTSDAILYFVNRERYLYYRGIILLSFAVALVLFAIFPLAPPRFMDIPGIVDTIAVHGPLWYGSRDAAVYYNAYAAMPSLHFAWTLLFGIMFWRSQRRILRILGVLYPTATFFAIVITGNHYVIDAVGGALMMAVVYLIHQYGIRNRLTQRLVLRRSYDEPAPE